MLEQERQFQTISIDTFKNIATHKMKLLSRLGLGTVYDLIFNLPFRYEDRTFVQPLSDLVDDNIILTSPCTVVFTLLDDYPEINSKTTSYRAQDLSGTEFDLTYFSCPEFLQTILREHGWFMAYGKVSFNQYSERLTMVHPDVKPITDATFTLPNKLSPIYHLTRGMRQEYMQRLEAKALEVLTRHPIDELIPPELNPFRITLTEALLITHNPPPLKMHSNMVLEGLSSFRRICFEELVAYKIAILQLHAQQDKKLPQHIAFDQQLHDRFVQSLGFSPTNAQDRALKEVIDDCNQEQPMSRILNGDVGSGKTLVAAMCMLQCACSGKQSVLLAPTEILAQQHQQKLVTFFENFGVEVALLTGSTKRKDRTEILNKLKNGSLKVLVGTHAVFQKSVQYKTLALVIVDEQHRFGVGEREALLEKAPKGYAANELLMTATPIPRSLRLALFNETKVSILNEMPKGRIPIVTSLIERSQYDYLIERLKLQCTSGEQAFWICPHVDEQENSMVTSVKARYNALQAQMPNIKIGLIHGKMSENEKNNMMSEFAANHFQILVATVIVEVGVDVPNASIIIIEDPQTMGLSQLHQLRGRVGRGSKPSYCILLYRMEQIVRQQQISTKQQKRHTVQTDRAIGLELAQSMTIQDEFSDDPINQNNWAQDQDKVGVTGATNEDTREIHALELRSNDMMDWSSDPELSGKLQEILKSQDTISLKRLKILQCTNNGFAIASQDLILRGPGEFFGQNQTGNENFKFADFIRDYRMLSKVNDVAEWIYKNHSAIAEALVLRWYPHFNELKNQKIKEQELSKQEQSKLIAELKAGLADANSEDNEPIFEVSDFEYPVMGNSKEALAPQTSTHNATEIQQETSESKGFPEGEDKSKPDTKTETKTEAEPEHKLESETKPHSENESKTEPYESISTKVSPSTLTTTTESLPSGKEQLKLTNKVSLENKTSDATSVFATDLNDSHTETNGTEQAKYTESTKSTECAESTEQLNQSNLPEPHTADQTSDKPAKPSKKRNTSRKTGKSTKTQAKTKTKTKDKTKQDAPIAQDSMEETKS